ncbi:hypothetical protein B0I27_11611 [Arcticibacter pallidicorallinus]|uniref:Prepilin-type N-terminal cleavage/methylation domain-containing protein n=1 Tax=Arcticibacter pallidicorallinus TaxID=1259464 RepID=A0A2T0TR01_9SPHI|nr:hypothetical protein [Arcticibacter pallidicorallinus]PRY48077.1 hypothetical protein B0I27_11611 [Arcticibacter pallidicorallinus]
MRAGYRVAAYTILEMTIAMLLAAITIGITYTAFSMIVQSYRRFDKDNEEHASFVLVDKLLQKDIQAAVLVSSTFEGIDIKDSEGSIRYIFTADYILRDQYEVSQDTFYIPNRDLRALFENEEATTEGRPVDHIAFFATLKSQEFPLVYSKHYSSSELIQLQQLIKPL